jgi:hypothetical protein
MSVAMAGNVAVPNALTIEAGNEKRIDIIEPRGIAAGDHKGVRSAGSERLAFGGIGTRLTMPARRSSGVLVATLRVLACRFSSR